MTLYFDTKVQFLDSEAVSTVAAWHSKEPIFAVASYSQDQGGSVTLFDDSGEPLRDITYPVHPISQATALCWHSDKRLLASGWENGEVHAWFVGNREFSTINGPHKAPIIAIQFSEQGGRMVTADTKGVLTGWRCDNQGQFLTMFTHDLRDTVLHITFRRTVQNVVSTELSNLAKAAVAGDETALDTLTNWRPRTAARNIAHAGVKDNQCFYVGTESGEIYYLNQSGTCTEVLRSDSMSFTQVLWHPKRDAIVTLMEDLTVGHFLVESNGALTELDKVKLSGRVPGHNGAMSWAGHALAIITGDFSVRIWDIDTSDNFLLPTDMPKMSKTSSTATKSFNGMSATVAPTTTTMEVFTCIAYCADNQTLCAGTNQGNLYTWKRRRVTYNSSNNNTNNIGNGSSSVDVPENTWQLNNISAVRGAIKHCAWGVCDTSKSCIMVNCIANVYILKEQPLVTAHTRELWATQKTANQIFIENINGKSFYMHADHMSVTDISLNTQYLIITNGRTIRVHKIQNHNITKLTNDPSLDITSDKSFSIQSQHSFSAECAQIFIYEELIIALGQQSVKIYSLGGVVLKELKFTDNEGLPIGASLTCQYFTIFTMNGFIKIYDIMRHDPKLLTQPKCGYDLFENFGEIIMARCNSNGTYIAATIANENLVPDGKIYVWNLEKDTIRCYDFMNKTENFKSRLPITFFWDTDDPRIFSCEAKCIQSHVPPSSKANEKSGGAPVESQVTVLFITDKFVIKELEVLDMESSEQLVNLCVPNVISLRNGCIEQLPLRDFKGIESNDLTTRKMILDFSLLVAEGNMDMAFRCIRSIQSESVWSNLARMCVQTGRLDVAKVCLGHMKKARSVKALRKAMEDKTLEEDAKVAVLAIELDMIEEAEALYKKCGRYDLLNRLLQACGRFDEALVIAEQLDRVHLKNTYFKYAEYLKEQGNVTGALEYYDKCNNATHNITQMLMEDPASLKQYMTNVTDPNLLKWWAQYIESTGDMESAFKIYQKADDWFSQVRILCFLGQLAKADSVARLSGDKSACYHLARHYENIGKVNEAIQFYTRAQTYGNAVRICKENDLQDELWNVANTSRARDKASAAAYFEEVGDFKRAVELYHRSGMLHKAVEMAFASQQPETLQVIASELDASSDIELVNRCADFFLEIDQFQKAVHLLAKAKQFERALEICAEKGVPVTESLAELLTPNKDEIEEPVRLNILTAIGDILQEQGDYHTATKKFTQAGDKIRAMKSLLKSGDTEKVVFFAGMSRQKEVYIMAANYLQALNWQSDSKILKNIVTFYSKGQAYDLLANFYATCAHVEIEEFRDYEKALKALQEATRCLAKVQNAQRASENLQVSVLEVRKVLEVQQALERGEFSNVIAVCRSILVHPERPPVRHGDIQAMLVEALVLSNQYSDALAALRELVAKVPDWSARGLVEKRLIEKLAEECGIDFDSIWNSGQRHKNGQEDGEFDVEEEIQEIVE